MSAIGKMRSSASSLFGMGPNWKTTLDVFAGLIADARAGRQIQRLTKQKAQTAFHLKKK
jgi:hypothetical protein